MMRTASVHGADGIGTWCGAGRCRAQGWSGLSHPHRSLLSPYIFPSPLYKGDYNIGGGFNPPPVAKVQKNRGKCKDFGIFLRGNFYDRCAAPPPEALPPYILSPYRGDSLYKGWLHLPHQRNGVKWGCKRCETGSLTRFNGIFCALSCLKLP